MADAVAEYLRRRGARWRSRPLSLRRRMQGRRRSRPPVLCSHAAAGAAAAATALALLAAGCGDARTPAASLTAPARPDVFERVRLPAAEMSVRVPADWLILRHERPPLRALITSGGAVIALWRYTATLPPPSDRAALELDRTALLDAARTHGGLLRVYGTSLRRIDGAPAVELDVLERIGRAVRRALSTHIYLPGAELVLEQYAPPSQFATVRREAFSEVLRSVRVLSSDRN
jgi:hypothetical protein